MRVYLDDHEMGVAASSLAEALRAAVAAAGARGRVIIELKADGSPVGDDDLARADEPTSFQELRLVSADAKKLVRVSLLDAADTLEAAKRHQNRAAELIQSGELQPALDELREALSIWQLVRGAVDKGAELLSLRLDELVLEDGTRVGDHTGGLKSSLALVKESLERQDWPALSDALAYDMGGRVVTWQGLLRSLADSIQQPGREDAGP